MIRTLDDLKARSKKVFHKKEAWDIAKMADSPAQAFNMAKNSPYFDNLEDKTAVRFLTMIRRDYGREIFNHLHYVEIKRDDANVLALQVIQALALADILRARVDDFSPVNNKVGRLISAHIKKVFLDFDNLHYYIFTSKQCSKNEYVMELNSKYNLIYSKLNRIDCTDFFNLIEKEADDSGNLPLIEEDTWVRPLLKLKTIKNALQALYNFGEMLNLHYWPIGHFSNKTV